MTNYLKTLNENQRTACGWNNGTLLVLAGPGSGKTRVLTLRIARILEETPQEYFKILGLTFTNKAATEMRERINQLVPEASSRTMLTTFHAFCADVLRQHGSQVGLKPDFSILSLQIDREAQLNDVLKSLKLNHKYKPNQLLPLIDRLLDRCADEKTAYSLLSNSDPENREDWIKIYGAYRDSLIKMNRLDFPSLIMETHALFKKTPGVLKHIHKVYRYICVDEFQDTNLGQYEILKQLVNPNESNLFVVADDDQIIYQWNGADPERINTIISDFGMEVIQLPENYRCPPEVIELANNLIENNNKRSPGKSSLIAHRSKNQAQNGVIRLKHFPVLEEEAIWIAQDIQKRPISERAECAILARTKRLLDVFYNQLKDNGLSAFLNVRKDEFASYQMQFLHSLLRLANNRSDEEQLRKLCKYFDSIEGIYIEISEVLTQASLNNEDYLRTWQKMVSQQVGLREQTKAYIDNGLNELIERLDFQTACAEAFEWFESLLSIEKLNYASNALYSEEKEVWENLVSEITLEFGSEKVVLYLLLQELDMRSKTPKAPVDAIPLFTIHTSKGLEFKHVYLVGMVEDELPSWMAINKGDQSKEMEEERRSCFVAITRAQESLVLSYSTKAFGWEKKPSRFLSEMGIMDKA